MLKLLGPALGGRLLVLTGSAPACRGRCSRIDGHAGEAGALAAGRGRLPNDAVPRRSDADALGEHRRSLERAAPRCGVPATGGRSAQRTGGRRRSHQAIQAAIEAQDSQALFEAATRAIAGSLIDRLEAARSGLPAGEASAAVAEARELYRAFEDGIAAGDPDASRRLGLAWLALSSSAGTRGVLGAGARAADAARFEAAVAEIRDYIAANFDPASFTPRRRLAPLPETVVATQGEVAVPPVLPPAAYMGDQTPLPRLVLNFEEQGIEETDLPLVAYGDMLFDSAQIFGDPARSLGIACSTCHNRSDVNRDLFIPGVSHQPGAIDVDGAFFNHASNDLRDDPIDIPSLRGLRFTGPYGRDGRFASLRDFSRNVIVGEFAGAEPTPFMLDALVAYMLEFDFLPNAKLEPGGRLTEAASPAARAAKCSSTARSPQMDGRACASCHVPSSNFLDRQAHDIGSVEPSYQGARSGALDTPTLLAARFTAPYFHDGSQPTLASVVGWFDGRYGLGLTEANRRTSPPISKRSATPTSPTSRSTSATPRSSWPSRS